MKTIIAYILALVAFAIPALAHSPPVAAGKSDPTEAKRPATVLPATFSVAILRCDPTEELQPITVTLDERNFFVAFQQEKGFAFVATIGSDKGAYRPKGDGLVAPGGADISDIATGFSPLMA